MTQAIALLILLAQAAAPASQPAPLRVVDRLMGDAVSRPRPADATVDTIMLHFCSMVVPQPDRPFDLDGMLRVFAEYKASAHYLIDRDGTVYRLVPETRAAFHAGKGDLPWRPGRTDRLNATSIGIEMFAVGSERDMRLFLKPEAYRAFRAKHPGAVGFTDRQYAALGQLIDDIRSRHPAIERDRVHIVGHEDYAPSRRSDPGELFDWSRVGLPTEPPTTAPATP
jgi:N-acetyl-anhydromuramyl-L-alanine amidase AmpD